MSISLLATFASITPCTHCRLPDFHLIFRVMSAGARSDVANATFTLTSTRKTRNLGLKFQATGEISGLTVQLAPTQKQEQTEGCRGSRYGVGQAV